MSIEREPREKLGSLETRIDEVVEKLEKASNFRKWTGMEKFWNTLAEAVPLANVNTAFSGIGKDIPLAQENLNTIMKLINEKATKRGLDPDAGPTLLEQRRHSQSREYTSAVTRNYAAGISWESDQNNSECFFCQKADHWKRNCPLLEKTRHGSCNGARGQDFSRATT